MGLTPKLLRSEVAIGPVSRSRIPVVKIKGGYDALGRTDPDEHHHNGPLAFVQEVGGQVKVFNAFLIGSDVRFQAFPSLNSMLTLMPVIL